MSVSVCGHCLRVAPGHRPPGQLSLFDEADGYRYQLFATNAPLRLQVGRSPRLGQIAFLEARHRAHGRVEDCIRTAKEHMRYRILHVAARLVRGQRRLKIRITTTWP